MMPLTKLVITKEEIDHYILRGHLGFLYDYRSEHNGDDPDPDKLIAIAEEAEKRDEGIIGGIVGGLARIFK